MQVYQFTKEQKKAIELKITKFDKIVTEYSGSFEDFKTAPFLFERETYKYFAFENSKPLIKSIKTTSKYGTGKIRQYLFEAIEIGYNLVNSFWRDNVRGCLDNLNGEKLRTFEKNLHDLYCNNLSAKDFFNYFTSEVGKTYSIVAYILFLKDCKNYVPIATTHFDKFFKDIGLDFSTAYHCSWENYVEYIAILKAIRIILEDKLNLETTLIDSHSFIWCIVNPPKKSKQHTIKTKYTELVVKTRMGQKIYKENLISKWNGKSSISNFSETDFLIASHIKPYRISSETECIDPDNGLLLTPSMDFLFDKGYITFNDNGNIIYSKYITQNIIKEFHLSKNICIKKVNNKMREYLKFHRTIIFKH